MTEKAEQTLDEAIIKFHKADEIEKSAKDMRAVARETIIGALEAGTIEAGVIEAQGKKIQVSVPMKKGKETSFDQSKAEKFHGLVEDTYPVLLPAIDEVTTYKVNLEVLLALMKSGASPQLIATVETYLTPATDDEPMAPRLQAK